jgi:hypothetical protein
MQPERWASMRATGSGLDPRRDVGLEAMVAGLREAVVAGLEHRPAQDPGGPAATGAEGTACRPGTGRCPGYARPQRCVNDEGEQTLRGRERQTVFSDATAKDMERIWHGGNTRPTSSATRLNSPRARAEAAERLGHEKPTDVQPFDEVGPRPRPRASAAPWHSRCSPGRLSLAAALLDDGTQIRGDAGQDAGEATATFIEKRLPNRADSRTRPSVAPVSKP